MLKKFQKSLALTALLVGIVHGLLGPASAAEKAGERAQVNAGASVVATDPEDLAAACARLAADPRSADTPGLGVSFGRIDVSRAIATCKRASKLSGAEPRVLFHLGRAYEASHAFKLARQAQLAAAKAGYTPAMRWLASLLTRGLGGPHDLAGAVRWLEKATDAGDLLAMSSLASHYCYGVGVTIDPAKAATLARKSAEGGSVSGMRRWAYMLKSGIGVAQDKITAQLWYRRAFDIEMAHARAEDPGAIYIVGWSLFYGQGAVQDEAEGVRWMKRANALDNTIGNLSLGWAYENGRGVIKDKKTSCDWYERDLARKSSSILNNYAICFERGEGRPKDLQRAFALYSEAAASQNRYALRNLAHMYRHGRGVQKDQKMAAEFMKRSAEHGHPVSIVEHGWALLVGEHFEKDKSKSCDWFELGAAFNNPRAINNIAICYLNGEGRTKDATKGLRLIHRSIDLDDTLAMKNLAARYESGTDVPKDLAQAVALKYRAALLGDSEAMVNYASHLILGIGTETDPARACDWYEKAAQRKHARALNNLALCYDPDGPRPTDPAKALALRKEAAERGDQFALNHLAELYAEGRGVPLDATRSAALFRKLAGQGDGSGRLRYALAQLSGEGVERDAEAACREIKVLAETDKFDEAYAAMGHCIENGLLGRKQAKEAIEWYRRSADAGNSAGMRSLARIYDEGTGTRRDGKQAAEWLIKAIEIGDSRAASQLLSGPYAWSTKTRRELQKSLRSRGLYEGRTDGVIEISLDEAVWNKLLGTEAADPPTNLQQSFVRVPADGSPNGLLVRLCRKSGDGKLPLAVINHGMTSDETIRRQTRPAACGAMAEFLANRGYLVAFPVRRGYGETNGPFREAIASTDCGRATAQYTRAGRRIADDIEIVIRHLRKHDVARETETIVIGHSGGGWGAISIASRGVDGISGYVNFSGAYGSRYKNPKTDCPQALATAASGFGRSTQIPALWLYVENNSVIGPAVARRLHRAYEKSGARVKLIVLPPYLEEGHNLFGDNAIALWLPKVEQWLRELPHGPARADSIPLPTRKPVR